MSATCTVRRRTVRGCRVLLVAGAMLAAAGLSVASQEAHAQAAPVEPDVFDQLQQNAWYLPTADGRARLFVTSMGRGPAVVVLHGGPGNNFLYLVEALRPLNAHYRFILFDQRGSLFSPVPCERVNEITFDTLVEDIEALRQALGEERIVLFGHSFGTLLAQAYLQAYPNHVAGMVLAASAPPRADSVQTFISVIRQSHQRMEALRNRPAVAEAFREAGLSPDTPVEQLSPQMKAVRSRIKAASVNLAHVDRWPRMQAPGIYYKAEVDNAVGNSLPEVFVYDVAPVLERYRVPVTVIQGDQDYLDPEASAWRSLSEETEAVHVERLRHAGHYAWIDAPEGFARALRKGLERAYVQE